MPQDPESHWATRSVIAWLRVPRWAKGIIAVSVTLNLVLLAMPLATHRIVPRVLQSVPSGPEECPVGGSHTPGAADSWGGCWPNASNTGYTGSLSAYTGPCDIHTDNVTIDSKDVKTACPDGMGVYNPGFVVTNSSMPLLDIRDTASLNISDSNIDAGDSLSAGLSDYNITATRIEVIGGQHSIHCAANCTVTDSFLHDQRNPMPTEPHNNPFISNGGHDMVIQHNTLWCEPVVNANDGGCSSDLSLFGDFEVIDDVLAEKNLMVANGTNIPYCTYGGHNLSKNFPNATNVRYVDNVFQKGSTGVCGAFGTVTDFDSGGTGNAWTNNKYDDGSTVTP